MSSLEDLTTDQLLARAQKLEEGNRLYGPLMQDPETRPQMLRLMKKKFPNMPIPEIDAQEAAAKELAAERAAREKLEQEVREVKLDRRIDQDRDRVKREYGLNDTDMAEVEKLMTDEKTPIPYWDSAAKYYKALRSQATPTVTSLEPPIYEMPSKDVWAKGIGRPADLNRIAMREATNALNDITNGRVKIS